MGKAATMKWRLREAADHQTNRGERRCVYYAVNYWSFAPTYVKNVTCGLHTADIQYEVAKSTSVSETSNKHHKRLCPHEGRCSLLRR